MKQAAPHINHARFGRLVASCACATWSDRAATKETHTYEKRPTEKDLYNIRNNKRFMLIALVLCGQLRLVMLQHNLIVLQQKRLTHMKRGLLKKTYITFETISTSC